MARERMAATPDLRARQRWPRAERRAQLLRVAEEVFVARGYQGTAIDDIATAAGVTRTLVYRYFADRDEIYLECVRAAREELNAVLVRVVSPELGPEEQLRAGLAAYFHFVAERGSSWDLLFGGGTAVAGVVAAEVAELRYQTAEIVAGFVTVVAPGVDPTAASAYGHAISGTAEQLAKWWRRHPLSNADEVVQLGIDALWVGLRTVAESTANVRG